MFKQRQVAPASALFFSIGAGVIVVLFAFVFELCKRVITRRNPSNQVEFDSFDCFDTLVARYHGTPSDFYRHLEASFGIPGFASVRKAADAEAVIWRKGKATVADAYAIVAKKLHLSPADAERLRKAELREEHRFAFRITRNADRVKDGSTIVSDTLYTETEVASLLRLVGMTRDVRLVVGNSLKHTGRAWSIVRAKCHLGDNLLSDFMMPSLIASGPETYLTTLSKFTFTERHLDRGGFPNLARWVRYLRLSRNPYSSSPERELWEEQVQFNVPLMIWTCNALSEFCRSNGTERILFVTRDCCNLSRYFERLHPKKYDCRTFHCSRRVLEDPPESFVRYARSQYEPGKTVIVDINGTGRSLWSFFNSKLGIEPTLFFTVWWDMNGVSSVKFQPAGKVIEASRTPANIAFSTQIEMLNYDLVGTLVSFSPDGMPVRDPPDYDVRAVAPYHMATDAALGTIPLLPLEREFPTSSKFVFKLLHRYGVTSTLGKLVSEDEPLGDRLLRGRKIAAASYYANKRGSQ
jgi:hypothetical protein